MAGSYWVDLAVLEDPWVEALSDIRGQGLAVYVRFAAAAIRSNQLNAIGCSFENEYEDLTDAVWRGMPIEELRDIALLGLDRGLFTRHEEVQESLIEWGVADLWKYVRQFGAQG